MIQREDFVQVISWCCVIVAAMAMVSCVLSLGGCAAPEPRIVTQQVDVPYPVDCTANLPAVRTDWPLDHLAPGAGLRDKVKAIVDDDAAWRDYARAFEAATAGCRK